MSFYPTGTFAHGRGGVAALVGTTVLEGWFPGKGFAPEGYPSWERQHSCGGGRTPGLSHHCMHESRCQWHTQHNERPPTWGCALELMAPPKTLFLRLLEKGNRMVCEKFVNNKFERESRFKRRNWKESRHHWDHDNNTTMRVSNGPEMRESWQESSYKWQHTHCTLVVSVILHLSTKYLFNLSTAPKE